MSAFETTMKGQKIQISNIAEKYKAKKDKLKAKYQEALLRLENVPETTIEDKNIMRYLVRQVKLLAEKEATATPNGLLGKRHNDMQ